MRSVGFGLAVLATTVMCSGTAFADWAKADGAKKANGKPAPKTSTTTTTAGDAPTSGSSGSVGVSGTLSTSGTSATTTTTTSTTKTNPATGETKTETKTTTETKPAPAAVGGNVTVHIDSPDAQVALEKRSGGESWAHVCNSPCDASVSVTDEYRIVGTDLNPSNPFLIDGTQGEKVTLNVTPGSRQKYNTGMWVLGAGAVGVVAGTVVIIAGARNDAAPGNDGTSTTTKNTNFIFGGGALIVAGVVAGLYGGGMMVNNSHTQVDGAVATPAEKSNDKNKGLSVQVTASRTPTWHEDSGPRAAAATYMPLLGGTF